MYLNRVANTTCLIVMLNLQISFSQLFDKRRLRKNTCRMNISLFTVYNHVKTSIIFQAKIYLDFSLHRNLQKSVPTHLCTATFISLTVDASNKKLKKQQLSKMCSFYKCHSINKLLYLFGEEYMQV